MDNNKALTMITWLIAKQSKAYGNIEVIDINQNEELRSDFIKEMYYHALITGKKLNEEQIKQEIATYRGLDAWAFVVPYPDSSSYDNFSFVNVCANTLYLSFEFNDRRLIPSFTIMHHLSKELGLDFNPYAMMGIIGEETLEALHASGFCPLAVFAPFVKKNLDTIDETKRKYEPLTVFSHDLYHLWSFSLLNSKEREFIFQYAIPLLDNLSKELSAYSNFKVEDALIEAIAIVHNEMNDVDIAIPARNNVPVKINDKKNILYTWLHHRFDMNKFNFNCSEPIGLILFFYQLCLRLYSDQNRVNEEYNVVIYPLIGNFQQYLLSKMTGYDSYIASEIQILIRENLPYVFERNEAILDRILQMNNSKNIKLSSFLEILQSEIKAAKSDKKIAGTGSTFFTLQDKDNSKDKNAKLETGSKIHSGPKKK